MPNYMAIDSCSAIYLSKLLSNTDDAKQILADLDNKEFMERHYENKSPKERPHLLQDKFLGKTKMTRDGKKIFANLMSIHYLSELIRSANENNKIELVITPIVLNELNPIENICLVPFLRKYCKVVIINNKINEEYCQLVDDLANAYANNKAMGTFFCAKDNARIPENDAYIMAEATLLGLNLITSNSWDFKDTSERQDCNRLKGIFDVNEFYNYTFEDQNGNSMTPRPMTEYDLRLLHRDHKLRFAKNPPILNFEKYTLLDFATYHQNILNAR